MEEINKELDNKSIERTEIKEVISESREEKPKKTRTEAQKQAFEKARKKREANLKARKEAEELDAWAEDELQREDPQPLIKPPPKKRGRPRKANNKVEPPAQQFILPPDPQLAGHFPVQGQHLMPLNPYQFQYYQPPAPQPAPVNNYYYYGMPPPKEDSQLAQTNKTDSFIKHQVFEPPIESDGSIDSDEDYEEIDYDTYANQQVAQLKYRFA
jgi:hypothetical protein